MEHREYMYIYWNLKKCTYKKRIRIEDFPVLYFHYYYLSTT